MHRWNSRTSVVSLGLGLSLLAGLGFQAEAEEAIPGRPVIAGSAMNVPGEALSDGELSGVSGRGNGGWDIPLRDAVAVILWDEMGGRSTRDGSEGSVKINFTIIR